MWNDLRFAVRMWRRLPGTTLLIIGSLALGIGASATVFSWAEGLIWRPLPAVLEPGRLVSMKPHGPAGPHNVAWEEFRDWQEQSTSYERVAAFGIRRMSLQEPGAGTEATTEPVWGMLVSGDYFRTLGVGAQPGRVIGDADARIGAGNDVAVISHALWQRRFGGSPDVLGRRLVLNGRPMDVIGVAPPRFAGTLIGLSFDVWAPLSAQEGLGGSAAALEDRGFRWLQAFGRLRDGVRPEQAAGEAAALGRRLAAEHDASRDVALRIQPLDVGAASRLAPLLTVLLGLAIVVLVVVCATAANLLMARAATREAEMAVRVSVGARPGRLLRQLMTETALLAFVAGGLGVLLSVKARGLFPALLPPSPLPLAIDTPLDARVVAFALTVTASTLLVFGLAPAAGAVRRATTAGLRAAIGVDRRRARWRRGLVAGQIALSLAALASCAIFAERLVEMREVDRGFHAPERVMLATTDFHLAGIADLDERRALIERLVDEARSLPGVSSAAIASFVPLGFSGYRELAIEVPGYVQRSGEPAVTLLSEVGADYFRVMGIPLLAGRPIDPRDRAGAQPAAVVNEALVRRFDLADPIGKVIRMDDRDLVIVGVARDGKYRFDELEEPARPLAYVPWEQWGAAVVTLHVRSQGEPGPLVPLLARTFASVDPRLPLLSPMTLDAYTSLPLFPVRLATSVLGVLAAAAVALAALGLYGVTSFAVATRTRELGIRVALGARPRQLVGFLVKDSSRFALAGLLIGLGLALAATRVLVAVLPRLQPNLLGVAAAALLLLLVCGVSVALAARRALRVDAIVALRGA